MTSCIFGVTNSNLHVQHAMVNNKATQSCLSMVQKYTDCFSFPFFSLLTPQKARILSTLNSSLVNLWLTAAFNQLITLNVFLPNCGCILRCLCKANIKFHPGRKISTAPGMFRPETQFNSAYNNQEYIIKIAKAKRLPKSVPLHVTNNNCFPLA